MNGFLQNYADPPVNVLLRKVTGAGEQFVIQEVPPFRVEFIHRMPIHGLLTSAGRMRRIAIGSQARMMGGVEIQQPGVSSLCARALSDMQSLFQRPPSAWHRWHPLASTSTGIGELP